MTPARVRDGVTLIEVLVVVGVIGVLVGLTMPAVQSTRDAAARASCQNNLRQVGLALQNFDAAHGRLPPADPRTASHSPDTLLSWMALILPQVEQGELWAASAAACRTSMNPRRSPPHVGYTTPVKVYVCAADQRLMSTGTMPSGRVAAFGSYLGVAGSFVGPAVQVSDGGRTIRAAPGVFGERPGIRLGDIADGASQTIMVAERPPPASFQAGVWYTNLVTDPDTGPDGTFRYGQPWMSGDRCAAAGTRFGPGRLDNPCDRNHLWSLHRGGANFAFADGSVRHLPHAADSVLPALSTRAGGEVIPHD
jgi:prepilin-type processing-associated H-X9-DG protein/prepilin-type N-terminal cleavage/methylation domain-containing protein